MKIKNILILLLKIDESSAETKPDCSIIYIEWCLRSPTSMLYFQIIVSGSVIIIITKQWISHNNKLLDRLYDT